MLSLALIDLSLCEVKMEVLEWKEKNKSARNYAHFDRKVSLDNVWNYISNPKNVKKHGFYPFIHYSKNFNKYHKDKEKGEIRKKTRELCYSAHIDRYIYSYYGFLINQNYNRYVLEKQIDTVAVAYRDNLGKNNIHFAKRAFDFIKDSRQCYVIIGDFTHFFDMLQHNYLKERLCDVLGVDRLEDDYYSVFKNITKYSLWELTDLLELNLLNDTEDDIKSLNAQKRVLSKEDFKKHKRKYIKVNCKDYGIPQGSAISAVLSNVYMINCDNRINTIVKDKSGLYMRYSDDFIIVLPNLQEEDFKIIFNEINNEILSVPNLILQQDKTQIYKYADKNLISCNSLVFDEIEDGKNFINYLGFTFDGREITIRDKTITKYYYRLYRKLNTIVKNEGYTPKGKRISCKNLYEKYSIKGSNLKNKDGEVKGNFITYVQRAEKVFGKSEPIDRKTKRHMLKIRRKLNEAFGKE